MALGIALIVVAVILFIVSIVYHNAKVKKVTSQVISEYEK